MLFLPKAIRNWPLLPQPLVCPALVTNKHLDARTMLFQVPALTRVGQNCCVASFRIKIHSSLFHRITAKITSISLEGYGRSCFRFKLGWGFERTGGHHGQDGQVNVGGATGEKENTATYIHLNRWHVVLMLFGGNVF